MAINELMLLCGGIVFGPMAIGAFMMRNVPFRPEYSTPAKMLSAWIIGAFVIIVALLVAFTVIQCR